MQSLVGVELDSLAIQAPGEMRSVEDARMPSSLPVAWKRFCHPPDSLSAGSHDDLADPPRTGCRESTLELPPKPL
jgi:hypothetical protein